jgi:hypothetical protein
VQLVFYEHLFRDREAGVQGIAERLDLRVRFTIRAIEEPSPTDHLSAVLGDARNADDRIERWQSVVDPHERRAGLQILRIFGLDRCYDDDPYPKPTPLSRGS